MVHALKHVHRILRHDGMLVNVHDLPIPHLIEVHSVGPAFKVGWLMDRADFENERSAFNALAQVVADGYYILEDERDFIFNVHVDDLNKVQEGLAVRWESAVLTDRTIQRVEELFRKAGQLAKVVLLMPARMTKLRARD